MRKRFIFKPKVKRLTLDKKGFNRNTVSAGPPTKVEPVTSKEAFTDADIQPVNICSEEHGSTCTSISHTEKKRRLATYWSSLRDELLAVRTEELAPATFKCVKCDVSCANIIKCADCSAVAYYCEECCEEVHRTVFFHTPSMWQGSMYVPYSKVSKLLTRLDHSCDTSYQKLLCMIDERGVQHQINVQFCSCEKEAITVLRFGMWPASPERPNVVFQLELMELCSTLQIESNVSIRSFCDTLEMLNHHKIQDVKEVKDVYRLLIGDCSNEYRYHRSIFSSGIHIVNDLDINICPACYKNNGKKILCCDANFGLVHKKSSGSGQGLNSVRHKQLKFFFDQEKVDEFVDNYSSPRLPQDCANFQAGNAIRSKVKNSKLDITGVFGAVCKHDYPQKFCNLRYGERLANAVYFLSSMKENNDACIFMYDIACLLFKHLQSKNNVALIENVTFAVPVFHSFAHCSSCQYKFGQRYVQDTGFADGEGTERLWAFLRRFSGCTKLMSLDNRHDFLVDALLHFGKKLQLKICERVVQKYNKATTSYEQSSQFLKKLEEAGTVTISQIKQFAEEKKKGNAVENDQLAMSKEEEYCGLLIQKHNLEKTIENENLMQTRKEIDRVQAKQIKLENSLKITEKWSLLDSEKKHIFDSFREKKVMQLKKSMKSFCSERIFLLSLMKKYADGQDIAIRVGKQLQSSQRKMKEHLRDLNLYGYEKYDISDVNQPAFYDDKDSSVFFEAYLKYMDFCRSEEEIRNSTSEMKSILSWSIDQESKINTYLDMFAKPTSRKELATKALLFLLKLRFEQMRHEAVKCFHHYIDVPDISFEVSDSVLQSISGNIQLSLSPYETELIALNVEQDNDFVDDNYESDVDFSSDED